MQSNNVAIIGAGLTGSLLAIILAKRGFKITVFEKRDDPRTNFFYRGRSIAMSLSDRGFKALELAGVKEEVKQYTFPKHSRMVHVSNGEIWQQQYGDDGDALHTINRRTLNTILLNKAEQFQVEIRFQHKLINYHPESNTLNFKIEQDETVISQKFDYIFATDGIFSQTANILSELGAIELERSDIPYHYKEFTIQSRNGDWALEPHFVHVWPRENFLLIALPNPEKHFTATLFFPRDDKLTTKITGSFEKFSQFMNSYFPDVMPKFQELESEFNHNPVSNITIVDAYPWNYKEKLLLLGDAAHAIAPFYAMGMNTCFEDVTVFDQLCDRYGNRLDQIIPLYTEIRKKDTDAISQMSLENSYHLKESVTQEFYVKWYLERMLWKQNPEEFIPEYKMVAFTEIPLGEVKEKTKRQKEFLTNFLQNSMKEISNSKHPSVLSQKMFL